MGEVSDKMRTEEYQKQINEFFLDKFIKRNIEDFEKGK